MWIGHVDGKKTTPIELFRRYGLLTTRRGEKSAKHWPVVQCYNPDCNKVVFVHGLNSLLFISLGIKLPKGIAPVTFSHYKHEGQECSNASKDSDRYKSLQQKGLTPEEAEKFKGTCLSEENLGRAKAIVWNALEHNYSDDLFDRLVEKSSHLWRAEFNPKYLGFLLLVDNVFYYDFNKATHTIRFVPSGKKGSKILRAVFDRSGNWIRKIPPMHTNDYAIGNAIKRYRNATSMTPRLVANGKYRQLAMSDVAPLAPKNPRKERPQTQPPV